MHDVRLRPAEASDTNFIYSTYLRGLYYGSAYLGLIDKEAFFANYEARLAYILSKASVVVACDTQEPDLILGYAISSPDALHYVYVKPPWRRQGLASKLTSWPITTVTDLSDTGNEIRLKRGYKFNPYLA